MSRATMTARAGQLPRAPIYGIARYEYGSEQFDFEIGWPEFERDTAWALERLTAAGLGAGDIAIVTAAACELPWFSPIVRAMKALRITYLPAEVYPFDAGRSAAFLQQFPVKAFVGLGADTVAGWTEKGLSPRDLLGGVESVWARPSAIALLSDVVAPIAPVFACGPALAMGSPGEPNAAVNEAEWRIDEEGGLLYVSNTADRAATFDRVPTGLHGHVTEVDGRLLVELTY
ncbi:hypothetical protein OG976_22080 [Mycobacterium sp. NBC_00419]|uniref:hypothetical protein n=1 Tax=Mycobacterium sp. NBC_00419 TaxID=2975989 RepID=UPI002E2370CD